MINKNSWPTRAKIKVNCLYSTKLVFMKLTSNLMKM